MFAAGPPIVRHATFEDLDKEQLGGWEIHGRNGTVDNVATSELDAFRQIRIFLSYLPSSIFTLPPVHPSVDPAGRREEELISIIPRRRTRAYDIRQLVRLIVDLDAPTASVAGDSPEKQQTSFFEIGATWGTCMVTGLARLQGRPIGVMTSDCTVGGGALDALGSQKATRFINLCDLFG